MKRLRRGSRYRLRVFLVGTDFFRSHGGIQYVNQQLAWALSDFAEDTPVQLEIFSYADPCETPDPHSVPAGHLRWHAFDHQRVALAWGLARRLREASPHLVLFTHVSLLRLVRLVRTRAPEARIAMLAHGVEVWEPLAPTIRWALNQIEAVVAPSAYTRQMLIGANGVDPSRIAVLPHGLCPLWSAQNDGAPKRSRPGQTLLSVARLSRADDHKGVDVVLRALPHVLERCPGVRYIVAGEGEDRPRLEKLTAQLGLSDRVEFRGDIGDEELCRAYREADVFVLPSTKEGFGIVFLEAMYHRLPVVGARCAATPEVVEDGVTGILVAPHDPGQLASAVSGLLLLPGEGEAMGVAGRQRVEQNFLFSHFAARWRRWVAQVAPEAFYLARHAAMFVLGFADVSETF